MIFQGNFGTSICVVRLTFEEIKAQKVYNNGLVAAHFYGV